jgi:Tol biopolymer transport system component
MKTWLVVVCALGAVLAVPQVAQAAFPGPANGRIGFASGRDHPFEVKEIFSVNQDGTGLAKLTDNFFSDFTDAEPTFSPDGRKIAFIRADDTGTGSGSFLYVMNADGTAVTQVPNTGFNAIDPSWSPDGSRIAFANAPGSQCGGFDPDSDCIANHGHYDVYTINVDGTGLTRLTQNPLNDREPSWSPDGSQIAYSSGQDETNFGAPEIYKMNPDGTNQTRLTSSAGAPGDHHPNWSPDSQTIVFSSARDFGNEDVWVMNADGSNQSRVTTNAARGLFPVWSPDGQRVAFTSDASGDAYNVYTIDPDGTDRTRVTTGTGARDLWPDWQPAFTQPPDCSRVTATPSVLARTDRQFVTVTLGGATDPEGRTVTIRIAGAADVTQDEPVVDFHGRFITPGVERTAPDAQLGPAPNQVLLRAERDPGGDGRVYRIGYVASDGEAGVCGGVVKVSVPRGSSTPAIDSAPPSYYSLYFY